MRLTRVLLFFAALACTFWQFSGSVEAGSDERLLKLVGLSRHGVRAPTQKKELLDLWSTRSWPVWPVKSGDLTPRGYDLVAAMWSNLRERISDYGIIPKNGCAPSGKVFIRADTDERTRATASAILSGLLPGCAASYAVLNAGIDPLFHPVKAGLYRFDPTSAATDVLAMTGGGLEQLQESMSGQLTLLDRIAGPPAPGLCAMYGLPPSCHYYDMPNGVAVSPGGADIRLTGSLAIASSIAEIFLLEYGEWPGAAAGWGQVDGTVLGQLLPVHSRVFDVVNRAPLISWARGSSLLLDIAQALAGKHQDKRMNDASLLVFVGHDTNIANIGGLLGIKWVPEGYPLNAIPPAGVLFFELWEKNGRKEVRLNFYAQTPAVLHAQFGVKHGMEHNQAILANEKDFLSTENIKSHAPSRVRVSAPPIVGQARYSLAEFQDKVQYITSGAPIAPPAKDLIFIPADGPIPQN